MASEIPAGVTILSNRPYQSFKSWPRYEIVFIYWPPLCLRMARYRGDDSVHLGPSSKWTGVIRVGQGIVNSDSSFWVIGDDCHADWSEQVNGKIPTNSTSTTRTDGFGDPKSGQVIEMARLLLPGLWFDGRGPGSSSGAIKSDPKIIIPSINANGLAGMIFIHLLIRSVDHPLLNEQFPMTAALCSEWLPAGVGGWRQIRLIAINCLKFNHSSPH